MDNDVWYCIHMMHVNITPAGVIIYKTVKCLNSDSCINGSRRLAVCWSGGPLPLWSWPPLPHLFSCWVHLVCMQLPSWFNYLTKNQFIELILVKTAQAIAVLMNWMAIMHGCVCTYVQLCACDKCVYAYIFNRLTAFSKGVHEPGYGCGICYVSVCVTVCIYLKVWIALTFWWECLDQLSPYNSM